MTLFKDIEFSKYGLRSNLLRYLFVFSILILYRSIVYSQPNTIPNLSLWLSADVGTNTTVNGSQVSSWLDQSGNVNDAMQITGANQPVLINNIGSLNYHPVLLFDGSDDFLEIIDNPSIDFGNGMTVFIVNRQTTLLSGKTFLSKWDYSSQGSWEIQTLSDTGEMFILVADALTDAGNNLIKTTDASNNTLFAISAFIYNGSEPVNADRVKIYKNGGQLTTSLIGSITSSLQNSSATLKIGKFGGGISNYYNGDVAEIIIYNSVLTSVERQQIEQYLNNKYAPAVNLGADVTVNYGFCPVKLQAHKDWFTSYLWSTTSTADSIYINSNGTYSVSVSNIFGYTSSDAVNVTFPGNLTPFSGNSITLCSDSSFKWDTKLDKTGYSFLWQDGSTDSLFTITQAGQYYVTVTDTIGATGCSVSSYTLNVAIDNFPQSASLGQDLTLCSGNSIFLTQGASQAQSYVWSTGATTSALIITVTDDYSVTVTDGNGCVAKDTMHVLIAGTAPATNFSVSVTCEGEQTQFTDLTLPSTGLAGWQWDFGDATTGSIQNPLHLYSDSGTYVVSLTVTTTAGCYQSFASSIKIYSLPQADFGSSLAYVGGNTTLTDQSSSFGYSINNWSWNFDDPLSGPNNTSSAQNPVHQFSVSGTHDIKMVVRNIHGCADSVVKSVLVYSILPTAVNGLSVWVAGDLGVTLNGNQVSQWKDATNNFNDASQSIPSSQPLFVDSVSILNHHPVLRFDGVDDFLDIADNPSVDFTTSMTVFIINKQTTLLTGKALLSKWDYPTQGSWEIQTLSDTGEIFVLIADALTDGGNNLIKSTDASNSTLFAMSSFVYNGGETINGDRVKIYKNGDIVNTSLSGSIASSLQNSTATLKVGKFGGLGNYYNGDIAEIIIYDTVLSTAQQQLVEQYLNYKYAPPVNLGPDQTISYGFCPVKLQAHKDWFQSYLWNTGETTDSIYVNNSGVYSVTVTNTFGYKSIDSIDISFPGTAFPFPGNSITICSDSSVKWDTQLDKAGYDFVWQDGSTDSVFTITQAGQYYFTVTDTIGATGCSANSYTLNVSIDNFPQTASLGPPTTMCAGGSIALVSGGGPGVTYVWAPGGQTTSFINVTQTGLSSYTLTATNANGCVATPTITVNAKGVAPTPDFTAAAVCLGQTTTFIDGTTVPTPDSIASWSWNFGDGFTATAPSPAHTYTAFGTYNATLVVVSDSGCTAMIQKTYTLNPNPNAGISVTSPICSGSAANFMDVSTIVSGFNNGWSWDFGDGTGFVQKNVSHTYTTAGTYTVQHFVTSNLGCIDTAFTTVSVLPAPSAAFTADTVCKGSATSFTGPVGIASRVWDFGDGTPTSSAANPTHTYALAGTYTVTLFVTGTNGCINTGVATVLVGSLPVAGFVSANACVNSAFPFIDSSTVASGSITNWHWQFGNGDTSVLQNPVATYSSAGTYSVTLTVLSSAGCSSSVVHTVTAMPLPVANFSFLPIYGAPNVPVNFTDLSSGATSHQWFFGDGTSTSTVPNPTHTYQDTGVYTITLITQSAFGCVDTFIQQIPVDVPVLDMGITSLLADNSSGVIQIVAELKNFGTLDASMIELSAYLDDGTPIHEFWTGLAKPDTSFPYQFVSSFELVNSKHSMVCVEIKKVNAQADDVSSNNKKCVAITDEFTLLNPFPNPTVGQVYFIFVSPDASHVKAEILDARGRVVATPFDATASQGLNQVSYSTLKLEKGMYWIKLSYKDKVSTKPFVKE